MQQLILSFIDDFEFASSIKFTEEPNFGVHYSFLENAQTEMQDWWKLMETRAMRDDVPIKPQRAAWELSDLAADDAIISNDSGTNTIWAARQFKIKANQKYACSGTLATMACGLPYAIAAKIAFPERQSIAFVGDGGFTMLMGEFVTAVKYNLPITVVIIKNNSLGQIKWEQIVFLGNPEYGCELQEINFAKYADAVEDRSVAGGAFRRSVGEKSDKGKIASTIFRNKLNELFS